MPAILNPSITTITYSGLTTLNPPLAIVEAIVRHSNPAMPRHYTHIGDLAASQAVAAAMI